MNNVASITYQLTDWSVGKWETYSKRILHHDAIPLTTGCHTESQARSHHTRCG
ncbi:hypothetical protein HMPREF0290_1065 [Corynebacterium efficiens YS-314]|uniref:Uncharacterized protein n=1 Tax=Corynebacterium efficiens (strain DSM 44549 / YS-314 / AJ 12310 / JCM 11189 / NBRC 100395) TaxID=196164 RepID=Q8FRU4_COREF|nr:hypothetical protein HMPREF0290_1065 [Corynebacterium efficiens YS-314]BAC17474.1 hypothetical protein [Corynebacterium efficiens YS-314]